MFCSKCKYHSFDYLEKCPKCGQNWAAVRKGLHLDWMQKSVFSWLGGTVEDYEQEESFTFEAVEEQVVGKQLDVTVLDADGELTDPGAESSSEEVDDLASLGEQDMEIDLDALIADLDDLEDEDFSVKETPVREEKELEGIEVPGLEDILSGADLSPIDMDEDMVEELSEEDTAAPVADDLGDEKTQKLSFVSLDELPLEEETQDEETEETLKAEADEDFVSVEPEFEPEPEIAAEDVSPDEIVADESTDSPEPLKTQETETAASGEEGGEADEAESGLLDVLELSFDEEDEALLSSMGLSEKDLRDTVEKGQQGKKK